MSIIITYLVTTLIVPISPKPKSGSGATRVTAGNCAEINCIATIAEGVAGIAGLLPALKVLAAMF
jgi:hypothetical protein